MEVDTIQSAESMDVDTNNYKPGKIFIFVFFLQIVINPVDCLFVFL